MEAYLNQEPPTHILDALIPNYPFIFEVVKGSWILWHKGHSSVRQQLQYYTPKNRSIGSDMSDILRAAFKEKFENNEISNVDFVEKDKLWFIIVDKKYVIRFNMMDDEGMTIRTQTKQSKQYRDGQLKIEGHENLEYLYGGYILDQSKSEIVNFYILKRNENEVPVWVLDQRHVVVSQPEITFDNPVRVADPAADKVRPKRTSLKKKLGNNSQDDQLKTGTQDA